MRLLLVAIVLALVFTRPVHAEEMQDIVITTPGERTTKNKAVLGGVAGAGVLAGAIGLLFNLDSRSAAAEVSAHNFTHEPWTQARQDAYDRASSAGTKAAIVYGVGGALLVGAVVAYLVTEPKSETTVIHPHHRPAATPTIEPAPGGGAMLGGMWSF
jgi:hypothetical protein